MNRQNTTKRAPRDPRRGNAMIEGAVALTISIVLIVGILDFGQVLMKQQGLVERVRTAARYAVTNEFNEDKIRNVALYNSPEAPNGLGAKLLGIDAEMVKVYRYDAGEETERITVAIEGYPMSLLTSGGYFQARTVSQTMSVESLGATP